MLLTASAGAFVLNIASSSDAAHLVAAALGLLSVCVAIFFMFRGQMQRRIGWLVVVLAPVPWLLSDVGFGVEEVFRGNQARADPLVVVGYPLIAAGLALLVRFRSTRLSSLSGGGLALFGPTLVLALFFSRDSGESFPVLERSLATGTSLACLTLAFTAVVVTGPLTSTARRFLGASLVVLLAGVIGDAIEGGPVFASRSVLLSWVVASAMICVAVMHHAVDEVLLVRPRSWNARSGLFSIVGVAIGMVASFLIFGGLYDERSRQLFGVGFGVLVLLMVVRVVAFAEEESEARSDMEATLDRIEDGVVVFDVEGRFVHLNRGAATILQRDRDSLIGQRASIEFSELLHSPAGDQILRSFAEQSPSSRTQFFPQLERWVELHSYPGPEGVSLFLHDVTKEYEAERQMRLQVAALEYTADMVVVTDTHNVIEYVNASFVTATGHDAAEAVGRRLVELQSIEANKMFLEEVLPAVLLRAKPWRGRVVNQRKDGSFYPEELTVTPITNDDGEITHLVIVKRDRTEWNRREEQLAALAEIDQLSGVMNRDGFLRRLTEAVSTMNEGETGSLLLFDLDRFHMLNDTLGHEWGDVLLKQAADVINLGVRQHDVVGRVGGDQFAVLLRSTHPDESLTLADRLRQKVEVIRFTDAGKEFSASMSVGVAMLDGNTQGSEVLRRGDVACYAAKAHGGNRVEMYRQEEEGLARDAEDGEWALRVKDALRDGRFVLHYQPIVNLRTHEISHHEVLSRIIQTDGSIVAAGAFMPAVERQGMIGEIDRWVFDASLRRITEEALVGRSLRLTINLSGLALQDQGMLGFLRSTIEEHGVDARLIVFEITETAAVANLDEACEFIETLRALGCKFALDDFGSGFSSFAYLRALPMDFIKIDGSFVKNLEDDLVNQLVVSSVNEIAHFLQLPTIAECVEDPGTMRLLHEMGVDYAQGYYLGKPQAEPLERLVGTLGDAESALG